MSLEGVQGVMPSALDVLWGARGLLTLSPLHGPWLKIEAPPLGRVGLMTGTGVRMELRSVGRSPALLLSSLSVLQRASGFRAGPSQLPQKLQAPALCPAGTRGPVTPHSTCLTGRCVGCAVCMRTGLVQGRAQPRDPQPAPLHPPRTCRSAWGRLAAAPPFPSLLPQTPRPGSFLAAPP